MNTLENSLSLLNKTVSGLQELAESALFRILPASAVQS